MAAEIKITGKYKDVDLSTLQPEQLQIFFTLVRELETKQEIIDRKTLKITKLTAKINAFKPWRAIIYKMCLQCNFLQNSYNDRIAKNSKEILNEVSAIKEALGERQLKLPDLAAK